MDYQYWLKAAAARLTHSDSARRDAEILLGFVTGKARTFLMAFGETLLTPPQHSTVVRRVRKDQKRGRVF